MNFTCLLLVTSTQTLFNVAPNRQLAATFITIIIVSRMNVQTLENSAKCMPILHFRSRDLKMYVHVCMYVCICIACIVYIRTGCLGY